MTSCENYLVYLKRLKFTRLGNKIPYAIGISMNASIKVDNKLLFIIYVSWIINLFKSVALAYSLNFPSSTPSNLAGHSAREVSQQKKNGVIFALFLFERSFEVRRMSCARSFLMMADEEMEKTREAFVDVHKLTLVRIGTGYLKHLAYEGWIWQ